MNKLLLITTLLLVAASGPIFEFELTITPEITFSEINVTHGHPNPASLSVSPTHEITILDRFQQELHQQQYTFRERISVECRENDCADRVRFVAQPTQTIRLPYHATADAIRIEEINGTRSTAINVKHLSRYCGNNICNEGQSPASCPQDCTTQLRTQETTNTTNYLLLLTGLTILLTAGMLYKRRKNP